MHVAPSESYNTRKMILAVTDVPVITQLILNRIEFSNIK